MTCGAHTATVAEQADKMISCRDGIGGGTRMPWTTCPIHLASGNTGEAYVRTFRAPDWSIAVPHRGWGAIEGLPRGDDGSGKQECEHHRGWIPSGHRSSIPNFLVE